MADWALCTLLLGSACANVIALGAFWAAPGLRTVANRFVINLLIANIASCALLLPCILLNASHGDGVSSMERLLLVVENNTVVNSTMTVEDNMGTGRFVRAFLWWGCDLSASCGSLALLLVVGDTWCAVTDPLRYHARINNPKAWGLIGAGWGIATLWAVLGALCPLTDDKLIGNVSIREDILQLNKTNATDMTIDANLVTAAENNIFDLLYSSAYFIVVILLPFAAICAMYWRIYCAARESGVRMRRNGSSPLLQSSTNLATGHPCPPVTYMTPPTPPDSPHDALTMRIDRGNAKCLVFNQLHVDNSSVDIKPISESMRRNHSARQLFFEKAETALPADIRHVKSSSDLQKPVETQGKPAIAEIVHGPAAEPQRPPCCITQIRHRLSNASSLFKYREESRAARISILVVIMFLVSYFPYGVLVLLRGNLLPRPRDIEHLIPTDYTTASVFLLLLANLSSPFMFAYRNKRVRRGVRMMLGVDAKTNERLNKRAFTRVARSASNNKSHNYTPATHVQHGTGAGTFYLNIHQELFCEFEPSKKKSILKRIYDSSRSLTAQCGGADKPTPC